MSINSSVQEVSYFKEEEEEILFSMHTVFGIGELELTAGQDQQLRTLTKRIREETSAFPGSKRLRGVLIKLSQVDKTEELYKVPLEQTSNRTEKALYYYQLGYVKDDQGNYEEAIWYYEKALESWQKSLPGNHSHLQNV